MRLGIPFAACLVLAMAALAGGASDAHSSESSALKKNALTIASWNIANLAAPGSSLRGFRRDESDYQTIRSIIAEQDADVFAFQEIGSIPALAAVLSDEYSYMFESRCYENQYNCLKEDGRIYTAIAVRREISHSFFFIDELSVEHHDECGKSRNVRGSVGVRVSLDGQTLLIPSLHMKATCRDNQVERDTEDDCLTQRRQYRVLREWMDGRSPDEAIVLAGDFNRELHDKQDNIRRTLFSNFHQSDFLPSGRVCWMNYYFNFKRLSEIARMKYPQFRRERARPLIFSPRKLLFIDYFIIKGLPPRYSVLSMQHGMDGVYNVPNISAALKNCDGTLRKFSASDNRVLVFAESYPSDHCPISLTIRKPRDSNAAP